ncbi:MAG: adenylate cyclase associated N terminal-domain-containing protein [Linnemannia elongata]|nr:MAG: adenylate cyclase associated N terminal-domain-containing protein [Linnemannia elongata]
MVETSSIAALLRRLDAVTTKLEDQAMAGASAADVSSSLTGSGGIVGAGGPRPSQSLSVPPSGGDGGNSGGVSIGGSPSISAVSTTINNVPAVVDGYDELVNGPLKVFIELSHAIGGIVEEQAGHVGKLLAAQREMIMIAALSHKPPTTSDVFRLLLEPTQQELKQVLEIREKNRSHPHAPHFSTLAEGIRCFAWVSMETKPATYIGQVKDTAQAHANKVIAERQEKEENHVLWAQAFIRLLTELQSYVRKYHTAGLVWNPKGTPLDINQLTRAESNTFASGAEGASSSFSPLPPKPPLAPAIPQTAVSLSSLPTRDADMSAVFAQLNQGETITSHLRPVDNTRAPRRPSGSGASRAEGKSSSKVPRIALEDNKWIIEHFENNNDVVLETAELGQSVYIFGCQNSTVQIKTKVTTVAMDSCTKTGLCVESLVTSLDVVNSKSVQLQILGNAPTVNLDKVDSCMVYLSRECMDTTGVFTTKTSGVNVLTPAPVPEQQQPQQLQQTATTTATGTGSTESIEYVEQPIPEQLFTRMVDGKMVTSIVEHSSG